MSDIIDGPLSERLGYPLDACSMRCCTRIQVPSGFGDIYMWTT